MKLLYQHILDEFNVNDIKREFDPVKKKYSEKVTTRLIDISAEGVMTFHSTAVTTSKVPYWVQHVVLVEWFDAIGLVDLNYSERANLAVFGDLLLRCNDPSFLYHGFSYILSGLDVNAYSNPSGTDKYPDYDKNTGPEDRYPIIRNPDLEGIVCKHLIRVLTQMPFMISSVAKAMKIYVEHGVIAVEEELAPEEIAPEAPVEETPEEDEGHTTGHFSLKKDSRSRIHKELKDQRSKLLREQRESPPEKFYLAFPMDYHDLTKTEAIVKSLESGTMSGVAGVSTSEFIKYWWLGAAREAMLTMNGDQFIRQNNIAEIRYDDPETLVADGMKLLTRIYSRTQAHQVAGLIGENIQKVAKTLDFMTGDVQYQMSHMSMHNLLEYPARKVLQQEYANIQSVKDLIIVILRTIDESVKMNASGMSSWYYEEIQKAFMALSESELDTLVRAVLMEMGSLYADEEEWEVTGNLSIPQGSEILMIIPEPIDEDMMALFTQHREQEESEWPEELQRFTFLSFDMSKHLERQYQQQLITERLKVRYQVSTITSKELSSWKSQYHEDR